MKKRDRATGWKHAKITGHSNEELIKNLLCTNENFLNDLLKRINYNNNTIKEITIGGLHEINVPGVLDKKTKSKIDLKILFKNNDSIGISIKKSISGQVYFVKATNFIEIYKKQFNEDIPASIERAIKLFWSSASDAKYIINKYADKSDIKSYNRQLKHSSLNATTLKLYDPTLHKNMLDWFSKKSANLTMLAFSMGGAKNPNDFAKYIWYKNLLGENEIDQLFKIDDLCNVVEKNAVLNTYYGEQNGGTTIQLPFGFVQWHQGKMQFHHSLDKIINLFKK